MSFESQVNAGEDISYRRNKGNYCQLRGVVDGAEKIVSINTQMKAIKNHIAVDVIFTLSKQIGELFRLINKSETYLVVSYPRLKVQLSTLLRRID